MRKVMAVALLATVQGAALSAPFVHEHPDDHATAHHNGRSVHTHWSGHARSAHYGSSPAFTSDDHDRAMFLNAFVAVAVSVMVVPAVAQQPFEMPVPAERPAHRSVRVVHSHDPPFATSLPSRAPPAFLS